jgi:hypothetical protein
MGMMTNSLFVWVAGALVYVPAALAQTNPPPPPDPHEVVTRDPRTLLKTPERSAVSGADVW